MDLEEANNVAMMAADMKKSSSDLSCTSIELYVPGRGKHVTDKECISMKSECGVDTRRRLSIINSMGKKASLEADSMNNVISNFC